MSIKNIPNIKFIPAGHRCHPHILDFVVAHASIGSYLSAYHGQAVTTFAPTLLPIGPQYPSCSIAGQASGKTINFVPDDVLRDVFVNNVRTPDIPYLEHLTFTQIAGVGTDALAETIEGFAQAMFTRYWESNLAAIQQVHGQRRNGAWPQVLQFAAIVRDAMSHGGTLHMFPSVAPATHFGLTYTPSMNGQRIIHNDLTGADIFVLMLDIDASF